MEKMAAAFVAQAKHGIMADDHRKFHHDEEQEEDLGSCSSLSQGEGGDDDEESSSNSVESSASDFMEDAGSSSSSSSSSSFSSLDSPNGPLFGMSSLISQLPFKRGLSKHFEGKSQSFTSLSNVKSLEDLIKPERPLKRRLKSSKSYGWGLDKSLLSTKNSSKIITKKSSSSKGSLSSSLRRHSSSGGFLGGGRPPQRPGGLSAQTLLETIG